jgi:two-component system CheB/CheR fusion protein
VRNAVVGAALTFREVTLAREAADRARADLCAFANVVDAVHEPLLVLDGELRVLRASAPFYRLLGLEPRELQDRPLWALDGAQSGVLADLLRLLQQALGGRGGDDRAECDFASMGRRHLVLRARWLDQHGALDRLLLSVEDAPERVRHWNAASDREAEAEP